MSLIIKRILSSAIFVFFVQFIMNGQDTLYKRSGEFIPAKILEINIKEVVYKRSDLSDGPLTIVSKNEVMKIKYANGQIDSMKATPSALHIVYSTTPVKMYSNSESVTLAMRRGVYIYQGSNISDRKLFNLALNQNLIWNNVEINDNIIASKKNKGIQYSIGYGGAALGIVTAFSSGIAMDANSGSENVLLGMIGVSVGVATVVSSQIVSFSYKLKRVKHANTVMELYNKFLK